MELRKLFGLSSKIGVLVATNTAFNAGYEYIAYPAAILLLGGLWGTVLMTCLGLMMNILLIKIYDLSNIQVIEEMREIINRPAKGYLGLIMKELMKNKVFMFAVLSYHDPLYAVLYLRKGKENGKGFTGHDWIIFILSNVMSNIIWGGMLTAGFSIIKNLLGF